MTDEPPKPKAYWWRFTLASVLIVAATAAATATSVLFWLDDIADALAHNNVLKNKVDRYLATVQGGAPENILILGSDKRVGVTPDDPGRSDTTILLRLDPNRNAIAVMSIPRDLKVEIPGYGTDKFNAAYTYGGPKLTLRVVKQLTGLPINHIVNVDFLGFVRAVNAIDCVYADIDRRYYHSNEGVPADQQYAEIDVKPGYQPLCGERALEYVRYRHTDTDLVRSARQQDFLREARRRVPVSKLVPPGQGELIEIFTDHTTSDISDTATMVQVMKLFIASRNANINEVRFPATLGQSFVYATAADIRGAVQKFLGIEASGGPRGSLDDDDEGRRGRGGGKAKKNRRQRRNRPKLKPKPPGDDGLVPAAGSGELEAKQATPLLGAEFPVYYPTRLPSAASYVPGSTIERSRNPRVYRIRTTDGQRREAYRMVLGVSLPDGTHYFGVQGIRGWEDPPTLGHPSITRTIGGREYEIFVDGDRVRLVAWRDDGNSYWVSNSLLQVLTNDQMLGIARSVKKIRPNPKPRPLPVAAR